MIYLISQILLCLALAAALGGAIGWLLQRSRGTARLDAARRALAEQARQLERARTDVTMLTDDFDDLRERSRLEIDALRQENRQLPGLAKNLEKSQLLVRQMIQRHDSQVREMDASNAALKEQVAHLQEQVVTRERALAEAAKAARGLDAGRPDDAPDGSAELAADAPPAFASETSAERSGDGAGARDDEARPGGDAPPAEGDDPGGAASPLDREAGDAASPDAAVRIGTATTPDTSSAPEGPDRHGRTASPSRRGWASAALPGGDAADELMDEVMELDDELAAELREDVDASTRAPGTGDDDTTGTSELPKTPDSGAELDGPVSPDGPVSLDASVDPDDSGDAVDAPWDEDEDGNATLAIEVFTMEDVHGVDGLDAPTTSGDASDAAGPSPSGRLFRTVDRQDDLKRIFGIGAVTEKALNDLGITSYPQLAELERPEIEKIAAALEIGPERIERDDWVGNARRQLEDVLEEL